MIAEVTKQGVVLRVRCQPNSSSCLLKGVFVDADGNGTEIGTTTFTLSGEQDMQQRTDITVPEDSDHVNVSISKASGSDPVLSWIGIVGTDEKAEPAAENLVTNGSFEEGATGWSLGNGASVQKGDDAPDGTQYMRDNGDANSWGDGSSQKVAVEPDTEYVLTGSAKVDGSDPYYVGANVDGKEIYAVFSLTCSRQFSPFVKHEHIIPLV